MKTDSLYKASGIKRGEESRGERQSESCHSINFQKLLWRKCKDGAPVLDYLLSGMLHCLAEISELLLEEEKKSYVITKQSIWMHK